MAKKSRKSPVNPQEWKRLYELANEVREMAPWDWVTESEFFAVQDPETGELGFISIMGMNGEHFAVAVYRGAEGLYGYWRMADSGPYGDPEEVLEVPQIQLSFEDRNTLTEQDRTQIKMLGLQFRGRNEWPMFRSYRPGYYPWYLEKEEVRFLTHVLEQSLDVLSRYKENKTLLEPPSNESYLVRIPQYGESGWEWTDEIMEIGPPQEKPIDITIDGPIMSAFLNMERAIPAVEADFFMFPGQIQKKPSNRPYYAYMLMIVEPESGMVLGSELLSPFPTIEEMWGKVPEALFKAMVKVDIYPNEIRITSPRLFRILEPVAKDIGFKLAASRSIPHLEEAKDFLLSRFM